MIHLAIVTIQASLITHISISTLNLKSQIVSITLPLFLIEMDEWCALLTRQIVWCMRDQCSRMTMFTRHFNSTTTGLILLVQLITESHLSVWWMLKLHKTRIKLLSRGACKRVDLTNFKYCIIKDGPPTTTSCGIELSGQPSTDMIDKFWHIARPNGSFISGLSLIYRLSRLSRLATSSGMNCKLFSPTER